MIDRGERRGGERERASEGGSEIEERGIHDEILRGKKGRQKKERKK